ncbi:hypothetical protein A4G26_07985 [Mycobacterium kansasii]|uniref:Phenylalanine aminotransferase n=1 Tax=Mycobacterium innocens TaxID=2341083 RepID=A0A498PUE5_9MYCO|nr:MULTISPECIES: hypothetical protein [Mycobacterium]KZS68298.1 hypothetical protein A4G26_07985 [Mycobacterium kansasii]VBA35724.1 Putative phenylalanine aminotransferase [Mycobacterium innocens]
MLTVISPNAIDPGALALNENPFPPQPAVRSALNRSIDAVNRYPEFLPERLRDLIAGHIGMPPDRVVLGAGATGVVMQALRAVAASYEAEGQLLHRVRLITAERRYLRRLLSAMGIATTDAHANFMYLPSRGRLWHDVFVRAGLQVRLYPDGGARITVGSRASTLAVLSAVGKFAA